MTNTENDRISSSKDVLKKTGISRATLNNYIRMGIIPRPLVQRPVEGGTKIKKIGYFPSDVIDKIESVKDYKKQGKSMKEITGILLESPYETDALKTSLSQDEKKEIDQVKDLKEEKRINKELQLTLEEIFYPAYLLNYDFEIEWINSRAENRILNQIVWPRALGKINIFKFFFNWEFHSNVKNWRDIVEFHMSFAKLKFSKTWLSKIYTGMTGTEIKVLEDVYDEVITVPERTVNHRQINILKEGGSTEKYVIYNIFFKEGILFVYAPSDYLT